MKWFLGNNFKISSEKWNETCSELISSPSLSLSDASVLFYFACVRVRFVSIYFYKRLVFFSDFYTREQPMCNQKLPFCPLCLVCTVFFFFSNYIIFFFHFYHPPDHTHTHTQSSFLPQILMSIFLFSFIFSFYRKYSYYDVFVESLFWIFFYMIELYSKTKSNKNEGYIYKWIYINYYKHLPKLLPSPDSKCVFRTETVILLFFFPHLKF